MFFFFLGDFDFFINLLSIFIISLVIFFLLNFFFNYNLIKKFKIEKKFKFDFYECGFKPLSQKLVQIPIHFLILCLFFLIYDLELIFLIPFVVNFYFTTFSDFQVFFFFLSIFFFNLYIDYEKHAITWQV